MTATLYEHRRPQLAVYYFLNYTLFGVGLILFIIGGVSLGFGGMIITSVNISICELFFLPSVCDHVACRWH